MSIFAMPICYSCIRLHAFKKGVFQCDAFVNGIPETIIHGDEGHSSAIEGDGGLRFKRGTPQQKPPSDER